MASLGAPLLAALAAFAALGLLPALDPRNIAWLREGDSATHYLGWQFFRQAPWTLPPGANPSYGLELASSVVYSDSIPLLALPFKLVAAALPQPFQYFGVWLLACFVLQAVLGWKLAALASERTALRVVACCLFLIAPPFLWRVGIQSSLCAHWIVLWALYLNLRPPAPRQVLWWALLLGAATLVHAYLACMALALWLADLAARAQRDGKPAARVAETVLLACLVLLCMWLAGYFPLQSGGGVLYGAFRMNLLSLIDASGWSRVLPDIPEDPNDYEGFAFLGLGMLLLAAAVLPRAWPAARAVPKRHRALLAVLALLVLLAISHHVGIARHDLYVPLPDALVEALSAFQASGRFIWPAYYALMFAILRLAADAWRPRYALALFCAALAVQIADTSPGWPQKREIVRVRGSEWPSALQAPFWQEAALAYRAVRWMPAANRPPHWRDLAYYAGRHGMATNAVYLARVDHARLTAARRNAGLPQDDTLYVFERGQARDWPLRPGDLLAEVDGLGVLAPGWGAITMPQHGSEAGQRR